MRCGLQNMSKAFPSCHLRLVFFLSPIAKNVELQWFLSCIVTILGKCGFEDRKSDHLGVPSNLVFFWSKSLILNSFLMVDTGSSYNRVVSCLNILYCVEGVSLRQQIISLLGYIPLLVSSYLVLHVTTGVSFLTIPLALTPCEGLRRGLSNSGRSHRV